MENSMNSKVEQLVNYIMKHCLWQFHSRAWDRERQNREILTWTRNILCGETEVPADRLDRCHWVDAKVLADSYCAHFPWIRGLGKTEIASLMKDVHERMDYLTITGSKNLELTDQHY
jgi:Fe-only nitrogenase delta subunit